MKMNHVAKRPTATRHDRRLTCLNWRNPTTACIRCQVFYLKPEQIRTGACFSIAPGLSYLESNNCTKDGIKRRHARCNIRNLLIAKIKSPNKLFTKKE